MNADLLLKGLQDFEATFSALNPQEQADALQYVLQGVTVTADKLLVVILELAAFTPAGSQNRTGWLPGLYDLRTIRFEVLRLAHGRRLAP